MHAGGKSNTEVSGRHLGASPDTCLCHIKRGQGPPLWLMLTAADGAGLALGDRTAPKALAGLLKRHAPPWFLEALRKELQDG